MNRPNFQRLAWVLLFVAELEYLLVTNYPLRTYLRQLIHLPIYHILLTFLTLGSLYWWLSPAREEAKAARFSKPWMLLHLSSYMLIWWNLAALGAFTFSAGPAIATALWLALGALLVASWLFSLISLSSMLGYFRTDGTPLTGLLVASLAAPYAAEYTSNEWKRFADLTFRVVEFVLQLLYSDVVAVPRDRVIGTSRFTAEILPGCSGYEGMGLIAVLVSAYFSMKARTDPRFRATLWSRAWILPAAMAAAWLANIVRLVLLIIIGSEISAGIAVRGFHSQAGWLTFTILGTGLIGWLEQREHLPESGGEKQPWRKSPVFFYLTPMLISLFCQMVAQSLTNEFNYLAGLQVFGVALFIAWWPSDYGPTWRRPGRTAILSGLLVYFLWLVLSRPAQQPQVPYDHLPEALATLWVCLRFAGSVLVAPLVEELAFRGYLMRRFISPDFEQVAWKAVTWKAILLNSFCFALLHQDLAAAFGAGLIYSLVAQRSGRLSDAVLAHSVTNLCLSVQVLALGDWGRW